MVKEKFNKLASEGALSTDALLIALDKEEISEDDALRCTIIAGDLEQLKTLEKQGATIAPALIMSAAYHGQNHIIDYFISEFNIDISLASKERNNSPNGRALLIQAASNNKPDTVDHLLKLGAITNYTHRNAPYGDTLKDHNFFAVGKGADIILSSYKKLHQKIYHEHFSTKGNDPLDKYQNTYEENDLSGFMLAARSGFFQDVVKSIINKNNAKSSPLTANILLEKHPETNMSIIDHLHGYKQIKQIFIPKLWEGNIQEFTKLVQEMPAKYRTNIHTKDLAHINNMCLLKKYHQESSAPKLRRRPLTK